MPFSTNKNQQSAIDQAKRNTPYYQSVIDNTAVSEPVPGVYPITFHGGIAGLGAGTRSTLTGIGTQIDFETGNAAGTVASSSALDDLGNTGATLMGLLTMDQNDALIFETVIMDGTNNVALANQAARVVRAQVVATGSTGSNQGAITITLGSAQLVIPANDNVATGAFFTVPANHVFILEKVTFTSAEPAGVGFLIVQTGIGPDESNHKLVLETISPDAVDKTSNYPPITAGQTVFMDALNGGASAANMGGGFSGTLYSLS